MTFVRASLIAALLAAVPASAQQLSITGDVTDASSGAPIGGARVVAGTVAETTGPDGKYRVTILGQETPVVLRVTKIGFLPQDRRLARGQSSALIADFELVERPLGLDAVVVTGSAGPTEVRSIGHSVSEIKASDIREPVASVDQLLTSKVPGVNVTTGTGLAGSGAKIRLRGSASVALSNQPLVYVDGVRIRSDGYPKNAPQFGERSRGPNDTPSPLNDIEPADIERVEVVRGPAATTLYGTEAAAGVIQIFTKRGIPGRTVWSSQANIGVSRVRPFGTGDEPFMRLDPWLRDATGAGYSLSVRGGSDVRYYIGGTYNRNEGVLPNDLEKRATVRGNFDMSPHKKLSVGWSSALTLNDLSNTSSGPNAHGLTQNVYRGPAAGTGVFTKESLDRILAWDIDTRINHIVGGATAVFTPARATSHTVTVGYDRASDEMRSLRPYGFVFTPQGILSTERWLSTIGTLDYLGRSTLKAGPAIATIAWGGQSITTDISSVSGYGEGFPGPSNPTVSSAAVTLASESRSRTVVAGAFSQATLDFQNKIFLTAGLRVDGSSSFGEDFGLQAFPRLSAAWVISDERFWPQRIGSFKLRAAYGQAGRAPGVFDASRTWSALGYDGKPAFLPLSVGNTQLGPERSAETEVGFDLDASDGRFRTALTAYRRVTKDALLPVQQAPSLGFVNPQLKNVGTFRATGLELSVDGSFSLGRMLLELGSDISLNRTKAADLGGTPDFIIDEVGWLKQGQPIPVLVGPRLKNPDEIAEPDIEENHIFGSNSPTKIVGMRSALHVGRGVVLSARAEYQGGNYVLNNASRSLFGNGVHPFCASAYARLAEGKRETLTAYERMWCVAATVRRDGPIVPGGFIRLRDASITAPLPGSLMRSRNASITLAAHNYLLKKSSEIEAFEPDMTGRDGMFAPVRAMEFGVPTPASLSLAIRATYW